MSSTPGRRMKIGDFLLRRLEQADVRHLPYDALAPVTNSSNKEADLNYGPRGSATLGEPAAAPNRPRLIRTGFLTTAWPGFWCTAMPGSTPMVLVAAALVVRDAAHAPRVVPSLYRF